MALEIFLRTLLIYLVVLILIRLMGKREVGELSAFDLVVAIMIAEVAVFPMEELDIPLYIGLIPVFTLVGAEIFFSYLCLKSQFIRKVINGAPSVIIYQGEIMESEMRKLRYNINDLLEQLREKEVIDVSEVEYAILETSGELSVILKRDKRPLTPSDINLEVPDVTEIPVPAIIDGEIQRENIRKMGVGEAALEERLKKEKGVNSSQVLFATLDKGGNMYVSIKERDRSKSNRE